MIRRKATGRSSWRREWWGAALLALSSAATAGGCADHVQSGVVACPCDTGVCCTSGVCAASESSCAQATQALSAESAGRWTGYLESYSFASGSGAVDLTLETEPDGSLSGQVVLGTGTPPSPPTDPSLGWPPGYIDNLTAGPTIRALEGVPYHLNNVRWTALRLRFEISLDEPWGPWCRLQTSFVWQAEPLQMACEPQFETGVEAPGNCQVQLPGMVYTPIDCTKMVLCHPGAACDCTASGCDATDKTGMAFDVALRGNEGNGSVQDREDPTYGFMPRNVRLIRASN